MRPGAGVSFFIQHHPRPAGSERHGLLQFQFPPGVTSTLMVMPAPGVRHRELRSATVVWAPAFRGADNRFLAHTRSIDWPHGVNRRPIVAYLCRQGGLHCAKVYIKYLRMTVSR